VRTSTFFAWRSVQMYIMIGKGYSFPYYARKTVLDPKPNQIQYGQNVLRVVCHTVRSADRAIIVEVDFSTVDMVDLVTYMLVPRRAKIVEVVRRRMPTSTSMNQSLKQTKRHQFYLLLTSLRKEKGSCSYRQGWINTRSAPIGMGFYIRTLKGAWCIRFAKYKVHYT